MKVKPALKKYLDKRIKNIASILEKQPGSYKPETFHRLRVEIKKLKALFSLIKFSKPGFNKNKIYRHFRPIFSQAGKIRELQLEVITLKRISNKRSIAGYNTRITKSIIVEKKKFFAVLKEGSISNFKKAGNKIYPRLAKMDKEIVSSYLAEKWRKIKSISANKNLQAGDIHEQRKRLKNLYYIMKCIQLPSLKKGLKATDSYLELLGKWHDCITMKSHFSKAISKGNLSNSDTKALLKINRDLTGKAGVLLNKINRSDFRKQKMT